MPPGWRLPDGMVCLQFQPLKMTETTMFIFEAAKYPTASGVYLMKGEGGTVFYVGKAKNLRSRLRSYFSEHGDNRPQIRFLLKRVHDIETIVTDTEKEALILENTLIKKYRPRYNINLRDDKTYLSLRLDPRQEFPMLQLVRRVRRDGALYFDLTPRQRRYAPHCRRFTGYSRCAGIPGKTVAAVPAPVSIIRSDSAAHPVTAR